MKSNTSAALASQIPQTALIMSNTTTPSTDTSSFVKLYRNAKERELYENMSEIYAIFVTVENLEKAYIRDAITATAYSQACTKLIAQFKAGLNLLGDSFDVQQFIKDYKIRCPAAERRLLVIGVPATVEHAASTGPSLNSAKHVAEAVQLFITLMDSVKLNMIAVDQIHPLLSDLMQSLNKLSTLPPDFEAKIKIKDWLITLNRMKASDELNESQVRQLLFDLEQSHSAFHRSLSEK